jgi:hypothetical protein
MYHQPVGRLNQPETQLYSFAGGESNCQLPPSSGFLRAQAKAPIDRVAAVKVVVGVALAVSSLTGCQFNGRGDSDSQLRSVDPGKSVCYEGSARVAEIIGWANSALYEKFGVYLGVCTAVTRESADYILKSDTDKVIDEKCKDSQRIVNIEVLTLKAGEWRLAERTQVDNHSRAISRFYTTARDCVQFGVLFDAIGQIRHTPK